MNNIRAVAFYKENSRFFTIADNPYLSSIPNKPLHIHPAIRQKLHAFIFQKLPLSVLSAESKGFGKLAFAGNYAKAGDIVRVGVDVQSISHNPRPAWISGICGNLTV